MARLSQDRQKQAIGMLIAGMSVPRIAQHLHVDPTTIRRLMRLHKNTEAAWRTPPDTAAPV